MRRLANSLLQQRPAQGSTIIIPPPDFPNFLDLADQSVAGIQAAWDGIASNYPGYETRLLGYGKNTDAGRVSGYTDVWVTNTSDDRTVPGSFRYCLLVAGKTKVKFAIVDDIVDPNKSGWDTTSNTLIDGRGYPGTLYGAIISKNNDNIAGQYLNVTQPFKYGSQNDGAVIGNSNVNRSYWYKINMWDTGDVVYTNGAYYFGPGGGGVNPGPYYYTVDSCRIGPNPGEYAIMSPVTGGYPAVPGYLNGKNNDARNGKAAESAIDHNAIEAGSTTHAALAHTVFGTFVNSICQGCVARNFKSRSHQIDTVACGIFKYGADKNEGGSMNYGQGSVVENDGLLNVRGCVYIPYAVGEAFVGFQPAVATRNGIPPWYVTDPGASYFSTNFSTEGGVNYHGTDNAHIYDSWIVGQVGDPPSHTTGFDWTGSYTLTHTDCTIRANAEALVHLLEDDPTTRAGNPCSTVQPPGWRDVHTGSSFPAT